MKKKFDAQVLRLGHDINIDQILHPRYLNVGDAAEIANHLLENLSSDLESSAAKSRVIVAGRNFGVGPSREKAVAALHAASFAAVLADSFGRAFYRNAVNWGLPVIECPAIHEHIGENENITIDLERSVINCRKGAITFQPLPEIVSRILTSGGLIPHIRKSLNK